MTLRFVANDMQDFAFAPADLAPGDARSLTFDTADLQVQRVRSTFDPLFETAYGALWKQFGEAHEMESAEILERRLAWPGVRGVDGLAMRYDLLLIRKHGNFVAVRDHTAVADDAAAIVHLSHVLIAPEWRRTGLAGWLRAFPIQTARHCLAEAGLPPNVPITLVAEMEYADGADESRLIRLRAYEKAGFRKIDPAAVQYHQPDFRPAEIIDATDGPVPLPFQLIVRRVGREGEKEILGSEVRSIVTRLYHLYGREFRSRDMEVVTAQLEHYPKPDVAVALLPPTA